MKPDIYLVYARTSRAARERMGLVTACIESCAKQTPHEAWEDECRRRAYAGQLDAAEHICVRAHSTGTTSAWGVPEYRLDWADTVDPLMFVSLGWTRGGAA